MPIVQHLTRLAAGLLVAVGLLLAPGCDSSGGMSESAEGTFTLQLTDVPADLDSAVVTVDRVDLVSEDAEDDLGDDEDDNGDDDDGDDEDDDGDEDEEGIITLTDTTRQIDLLQLQGGVNTTLGEVTVPEGEYTQLRFVLGEENYVVVDGNRQMLQVPSGQQSGIKIILPEVEVENDGDRIEVTLDFDVDESFVETGSGRYIFKPTIKVKEVFVNGESVETVSVDGTVSSAGSDAVAVDSIPFAITDRTEFDSDNGASSPADLQVGQFVEVEGTVRSDGSLEALELEVEDDDEPERSITSRLESVTTPDSTITQLGVTIRVTDTTEFDDDDGLGDLEVGDRVETDYEFQNGARIATEIEAEDDD